MQSASCRLGRASCHCGALLQCSAKQVAAAAAGRGCSRPSLAVAEATLPGCCVLQVRRVAQLFPTAIISGRGREKVQQFVQLAELYYAGRWVFVLAAPLCAAA